MYSLLLVVYMLCKVKAINVFGFVLTIGARAGGACDLSELESKPASQYMASATPAPQH
jgi:hypothetical protein